MPRLALNVSPAFWAPSGAFVGLRLRTLLEIGLDLIDQSPCFRRPNFERRVHLRLDFIAFVFFATFLAVFFLPTDFRSAVGFHAFAALPLFLCR